MITIWVPGHAKTKGSLRCLGRGRHEEAPGSKEWRRKVASLFPRRGWEGPIGVSLRVFVARPGSAGGRLEAALRWLAPIWSGEGAGDIDKLARNVLDALGSTDPLDAGVYGDDVQVVRLECDKVLCAPGESPGALITVWQVPRDLVLDVGRATRAQRRVAEVRQGLAEAA